MDCWRKKKSLSLHIFLPFLSGLLKTNKQLNHNTHIYQMSVCVLMKHAYLHYQSQTQCFNRHLLSFQQKQFLCTLNRCLFVYQSETLTYHILFGIVFDKIFADFFSVFLIIVWLNGFSPFLTMVCCQLNVSNAIAKNACDLIANIGEKSNQIGFGCATCCFSICIKPT